MTLQLEDRHYIYIFSEKEFMKIYQHLEGRTWNIKIKIAEERWKWNQTLNNLHQNYKSKKYTYYIGSSIIDKKSRMKIKYFNKYGNFPGEKQLYKNMPKFIRKYHYVYNYYTKHGGEINRDHFEFQRALSAWSKAVREKAEFKCQICRERAEHSHHIFYVSNYPKLSLNINNGIALCKKHHKEIHSFGYKTKV